MPWLLRATRSTSLHLATQHTLWSSYLSHRLYWFTCVNMNCVLPIFAFAFLAALGLWVIWVTRTWRVQTRVCPNAGDKVNHVASKHLPRMLYNWPCVVFSSWSILLPSIVKLSRKKASVAFRRTLRNHSPLSLLSTNYP
jgi:hypothetical protein